MSSMKVEVGDIIEGHQTFVLKDTRCRIWVNDVFENCASGVLVTKENKIDKRQNYSLKFINLYKPIEVAKKNVCRDELF